MTDDWLSGVTEAENLLRRIVKAHMEARSGDERAAIIQAAAWLAGRGEPRCCCVPEVKCGDDCRGCPVHGPLCQCCGAGPTKEFGAFHVCRDCFWKVAGSGSRKSRVPMHMAQRQVAEFHHKLGVPVAARPSVPPPEIIEVRKKLARGETEELCEALDKGDLVAIADAIADGLYERYGTADVCGMNAKPFFDEVHRSNLTKSPNPDLPGGKAVKGPRYSPPDLEPILAAQGYGRAPEREEGDDDG